VSWICNPNRSWSSWGFNFTLYIF